MDLDLGLVIPAFGVDFGRTMGLGFDGLITLVTMSRSPVSEPT